jgi:dephospho-CoA kinase
MYKLGITGGIGSGKTTACLFFKEKGAFIFDADIEAKKLLNNKSIISKIATKIGSEVVINDALDIKALSEIVFKSSKFQNNLNQIIWPEILKKISTKTVLAQKSKKKLFIVDAALLLEANFQNYFDSTLLITAKKSIRYSRVLIRNNIPKEQIKNRMNLQMPEIEKQALANYTIENNDGVLELNKKLNIFYDSLKI